MAENLNTKPQTGKSWCYENDNFSCKEYGRLYDWEAANTVCPAGWHLPSNREWGLLVETVGGSSTAGKKLKSQDGWYNNGNGTNEYKFSALPGGYRSSNGSVGNVGSYGYWWAATEGGSGAYYRRMSSGDVSVYENADGKSYGFSVRCLQD